MCKQISYFPIPKYCVNCIPKTKIEYIDSSYIYGKSYGMIYICKKCETYVGVHDNTNVPLGVLANKELRELKKSAHELFDKLWKNKENKYEARKAAYKWLANELDLKELHFGWLNKYDLKLAIQILKMKSLTYLFNNR